MTDVKKPHQNNVKIKHTYEYISCCKYMQPPILRGCALVASHMASDYSLRSWSIPQRDKNVINVGYCCICECSAIWRLLRLQRVSKRLLGELHTLHYFWFLKSTWFEQRGVSSVPLWVGFHLPVLFYNDKASSAFISKWLVQESFHNQFKIFWYGVLLKRRGIF